MYNVHCEEFFTQASTICVSDIDTDFVREENRDNMMMRAHDYDIKFSNFLN